MHVTPIDSALQDDVIAATAEYVHHAGRIFGKSFAMIPITFDLKGRTAGMYRVQGQGRVIRYNPYIFAKFFADNLAVTVPHEVAHYVTDAVFGLRNIRPHGREWTALMKAFGADARPTCTYDLEGVPQKRYRHYVYHCGCTTHRLTSRRHNKVLRGTARYYCRRCRNALVQVASHG